MYCFLLILVLCNIWQILIKQKRWKNLPFLAFYYLAFIAILMRAAELLIGFSRQIGYLTLWLNEGQPQVKIAAGLVQAWMIYEVGQKIHERAIMFKKPWLDRNL